MKLNRNSVTYTLVYIVALVVIVGVALTFTATSLKEKQQANADADKMKQILASVHLTATDGDISALYNNHIKDAFLVNSKGERVEGNAFRCDVAAQSKLEASKRLLPVFVCNLGQEGNKYIVPAYGAGLWGPIWGYVAVNQDGSTIYGAYFSHQGETPGLGAEIEKPAFSDQFMGRSLQHNGQFIPIEVVKRGQKPTRTDADYVNGVSGGTITSKGVGAMLDNCLSPYAAFFEKINNGTNKATHTPGCQATCNKTVPGKCQESSTGSDSKCQNNNR